MIIVLRLHEMLTLQEAGWKVVHTCGNYWYYVYNSFVSLKLCQNWRSLKKLKGRRVLSYMCTCTSKKFSSMKICLGIFVYLYRMVHCHVLSTSQSQDIFRDSLYGFYWDTNWILVEVHKMHTDTDEVFETSNISLLSSSSKNV